LAVEGTEANKAYAHALNLLEDGPQPREQGTVRAPAPADVDQARRYVASALRVKAAELATGALARGDPTPEQWLAMATAIEQYLTRKAGPA
jgi:hypothetical protein